jgi:hypothetical protein
MARGGEIHALVLPCGREHEAGLVGREVRLHADVAPGVVVLELALVEGQELDVDARFLFFLLLILIQDPVLPAFLVQLQVHFRPLEVHFGHHHPAAQQRQQANGRFHRIRREHVVLGRPIGIGEAHLFDTEARVHPVPHRLEIAFDPQFTAGGVGDGPRNRSAQGVQTESDEKGQRNEQTQNQPCGPFEDGSHTVSRCKTCAPPGHHGNCDSYQDSATLRALTWSSQL